MLGKRSKFAFVKNEIKPDRQQKKIKTKYQDKEQTQLEKRGNHRSC